MTLGEALQAWRIGAGFETQARAAMALSANPGKMVREKDVSRWESGKAAPRLEVMIRMARVYGPPPFDWADLRLPDEER
jgi:hypothetical protein